jgi:hypothetical protein
MFLELSANWQKLAGDLEFMQRLVAEELADDWLAACVRDGP